MLMYRTLLESVTKIMPIQTLFNGLLGQDDFTCYFGTCIFKIASIQQTNALLASHHLHKWPVR